MSGTRLASTVVCLRDGTQGLEVLLVERHPGLRAWGGAWVFPGGTFTEAETLLSVRSPEAAARRAAVRELSEEVGVTVSEQSLVPHARWVTPLGEPHRYRTWFFLLSLQTAAIDLDRRELTSFRWVSIKRALFEQAAQTLNLPAPTFVSLCLLSEHDRAAGAIENLRRDPTPELFPRLLEIPGGRCALLPEDIAYANADSDLEQPGPRHRVWMQPGQFRYELPDGRCLP